VQEVSIRNNTGAFPMISVATRSEAVYAPHAFQTKTQATAKQDLDVAAVRLRDLTRSAS
jgi:phage-related protein